MREFEAGSSKKDRFRDRKQARRAKRQQQEAHMMPDMEPPKGYSMGGGVARGMGAARKGGKYEMC